MDRQFKSVLLVALIVFSGICVEGFGHPFPGHHGPGYAFWLKDNYYKHSCPDAETVIGKTVSEELDKNLKHAAGIIRMQFHDCFVEGCDASVLLDGPHTEKQAPVNAKLAGYEVIDAAKAAVENICPGVVSCADILAYAARDSTVKLNGSSWAVQGGRRDGFHSSADQAEADLPPPEFQVPQLIDSFARRGLSAKQMVVLSGAHTVGVGHCADVVSRLYNFDEVHFTDPTLHPERAAQLKADCPQHTFNDTVELLMDAITPAQFDAQYYNTLKQHKGLFTSDQSLFSDHRTKGSVKALTRNKLFQREFGRAMRAMAAVGVKNWNNGEIRKHCRSVNP